MPAGGGVKEATFSPPVDERWNFLGNKSLPVAVNHHTVAGNCSPCRPPCRFARSGQANGRLPVGLSLAILLPP